MVTTRSNQTDDDYLRNHTVQPLVFQSYRNLRNKKTVQPEYREQILLFLEYLNPSSIMEVREENRFNLIVLVNMPPRALPPSPHPAL